MAYKDIILAKNPIFYTEGNSLSGTTITDEVDSTGISTTDITASSSVRVGPEGDSLIFNGTSSFFEYTAAKMRINGDLTYCFWLRVDIVSASQRIFEQGLSGESLDTNVLYYCNLDTVSYLSYFHEHDIGVNYSSNTGSDFIPEIDTVYFITLVRHDYVIDWYINGICIKTVGWGNSSTASPTIGPGATTKFHCGRSIGATNYLDGYLNALAIFDKALSSSEIQELYYEGIKNDPVSSTHYEDTVIATGPIAYWRLKETVGPTAVDEMSSYNLIYNTTTYVEFDKIPGPILSDTLDRGIYEKAGDYVANSSDAIFKTTLSGTTWSMGIWTKILHIDSSTFPRIIGNWDQDISGVSFWMSSNGTMTLGYENTNNDTEIHSIIPTGIGDDGSWHFFLVTCTSSKEFTFYIDGVQTDTYSGTANIDPGTTDFKIGKGEDTDWANFFFSEAAVWDKTLSSVDIENIYVASRGSEIISGVVEVDSSVSAQKVIATDSITNELYSETTSDAGTGAYTLKGLLTGNKYNVSMLPADGSGIRPLSHGPIGV